jgi:hypothetical protein
MGHGSRPACYRPSLIQPLTARDLANKLLAGKFLTGFRTASVDMLQVPLKSRGQNIAGRRVPAFF